MNRSDLSQYTDEELAAELAERHCDHDSGDIQYSVKIEAGTKIVASYLMHQYCRVYSEDVYPESARSTTVSEEGLDVGLEEGDEGGDSDE